MPERSTEITIAANDVGELFRKRAFDPLADDVDSIGSIAEMAQLPHLVSQLANIRLRVLLPAREVTAQTEARVQRALLRYCSHAITEVRERRAAMRWVGLRASLLGLIFFGLSLAAATTTQRLGAVPESLRTLASESLIVAGWVLLWQPLDTLVQGWWPQWQEERTFRAIGAIPVKVTASESGS